MYCGQNAEKIKKSGRTFVWKHPQKLYLWKQHGPPLLPAGINMRWQIAVAGRTYNLPLIKQQGS